jgi:hypothetical protein
MPVQDDVPHLLVYEVDGAPHVVKVEHVPDPDPDLPRLRKLVNNIPGMKILELRRATLEEIAAKRREIEENPNHVPITSAPQMKEALDRQAGPALADEPAPSVSAMNAPAPKPS